MKHHKIIYFTLKKKNKTILSKQKSLINHTGSVQKQMPLELGESQDVAVIFMV
jgi:hypothetical protein